MAEPVYFIPARFDDEPELLAAKIAALYDQADLGRTVSRNDLVAIKMHFGERGNTCHIQPQHIKPLVDCVRQRQAKPFLTDTSTLYVGRRSNAVDHQMLAYEHGFTPDRMGAPVVLCDGLFGSAEIEVPVNGDGGKTVALAADIVRAQSCLVATHITGHCQAGLGGAVKNVAMGTASRKAKLNQHSQAKPRIDAKTCIACGQCVEWCPAGAISSSADESAMVIDREVCIGCGECLTVCREGAVRFDWGIQSAEMQRRMIEQVAGFQNQKRGKVAYVSFVMNISQDCDCLGQPSAVEIDDVGVLAGFCPLAVDQACLDLIQEHSGQSLCDHYWPQIDPTVIFSHGREVGLGTGDYELVTVKHE